MRLLITFIITIMITATAVGQEEDRNSKKERIQALKVAYITEKLSLTPDQAQVFWPIYNTYGERMSEIYSRERKVLKETRDQFDTMDESSAKKTLDNIQSFEQQKLDARKALFVSLKNKLSYKKTLILLKAEGDFRRDLLHKLRGDKDGKRDHREP